MECVDKFRHLGVIYSRSCSFDLCVDTLTKSGLKAMMAMLSRAQLLGGLDVDIKCRLFDVLVAPILTYGCEVWGIKCYDSLEKTLLKFCKLVLGVPNSATTDAVLGDLARFPLWITTQFHAVQYWVRCSMGEAPELVVEATKLSKMMAKHNFKSWYMKINTIISRYGFAYIMEDIEETNFRQFLSEFGQ